MSVGSYPKMDHYLIFKRKDVDTVEVSNEIYEMEWEMDIEAARFLHALDGKTDPYKISAYMSREEVNQLLEVFEDEWLLADDDKIIPLGFGTALIPLWTPKITRWYRLIGSLWNKMLLFCWIPVFICGVWIFLRQQAYMELHRDGLFCSENLSTYEAREILYKSQLANIAYNIELIPGYNIIGTSPTTILDFGLPLKILKTFDQSTLIYKLYSETTINICRMVYEQYADYMVIIKFLLRNGIIWKNFVVTMGF